MLEFLLKYSPAVFREGQIALKHWPSLVALVGTASFLLFTLWFGYQKTTLQIGSLLKKSLIILKFTAIGLLLFALLEPIVTVSKIIPRKSSLVLLVDVSRSMSIQDATDRSSRMAFVANLLGDSKHPGLLDRLETNFRMQTYAFSSDVENLRNSGNRSAQGEATNLAKALNFAAELGAQGAVAGVLVLTDGADNGDEDPLEAADILRNKKIPIYAVGIGREKSEDIEVSKVAANHSVIENSVVEISALVGNNAVDSREIRLELREEGTIVKQQSVKLHGAATHVAMKFSPQKRGFVRYTLDAVAHENETIKQNNSKSFLIDNRPKRAKILYIEGRPRAEFKYIRRAVDGDESLKLVSLLRTGLPDKFYRQGVENREELKHGYPKSKDELFEYDAIIFGQIEADFFSEVELKRTLDFVSKRGGGFLMLGGVSTFADGGYGTTPIEKLLPVELPNQNGSAASIPAAFQDKFKLLLTREGLRSPILQLSTNESENGAMWEKMPDLEGYNPVGRAKPGATILAIHPLSERDNPKIILANQRFGRGRSMVLATSSTWHWQMGLPHEDMSHERFWRQMLRWLALNAPKALECHFDKETYTPYEQVNLIVDVRDSSFNYIENASIKAVIKTPSGKTIEVPFNWSSNGKVEYIGAYHPEEEGLYVVEITAYSSKGAFLGRTENAFFVEESKAEFTRAQLQSGLLKRIAEISGGKYYHEAEAGKMADDISVMKSSYSKLVEYDLWDMPLIFLMAIVLLSIEWYVRRNKGLS